MLPARQGWGTTVSSPRPLWGANPPCRKPPREETTGLVRPLRKGKYSGPQTRPSSPVDPKSCVCAWGWELVGWKASRLEELTPAFPTTTRSAYNTCPSTPDAPWGKHIWNRTCGSGEKAGSFLGRGWRGSRRLVLPLTLDRYHVERCALLLAPFYRVKD
jgi:hypothetical protein